MSILSAFTPKKAPVLVPRQLEAGGVQQSKFFIYGASGTGKTRAIVGFLLAGLKIVVLSTEAGGHGLRTIVAALKEIGRSELLANLVFFQLRSFAEVNFFLKMDEDDEDKRQAEFIATDLGNGYTIETFSPDMLVWEGFSNFQNNYTDEHVLGMEYAGKVEKVGGKMREEGLIAGEKDYDAIGRISKRFLDSFAQLVLAEGKLPHIYVNAWELEPATPAPGREVKDADKIFRPDILGATRRQIGGYFDFVFRAVRKQPLNGGVRYEYIVASPDCMAKQRDTALAAVEPADMEALWKKINQ